MRVERSLMKFNGMVTWCEGRGSTRYAQERWRDKKEKKKMNGGGKDKGGNGEKKVSMDGMWVRTKREMWRCPD